MKRGQRKTRFRDWHGPHSDRRALGYLRGQARRMLAAQVAAFEVLKQSPTPLRPPWLKSWAELMLGYSVADAWIGNGAITVQTIGHLENVSVTLTFER
jgi:hypothetical protein